MAHWTENAELHEDGSMVRPYTITRGRTASESDDLTLITVVATVTSGQADGGQPRPGLQPEHRAILELCRQPKAVAEIAGSVNLPVSVTKILIGDLITTGCLRARPPLAFAYASGFPDMTILEAVRDGLRGL
ncbi:DUF742 domain-containing protein [Streptomyces sp. NPDC048420]|uniref:DUF742 domain-containing protein n=1 Tax=Streptomyces sp. NPDC048420 TaxID=3155755 RepID=UPI0034279E2E